MNKAILISCAIGLLLAGFLSGRMYEAWSYDDTCLDLGGGKSPGEYPICVVTESPDAK